MGISYLPTSERYEPVRKSDVYLPTPPAFWSQSDGNYLPTPKIELKLKPPKYLFETAERSASSFKLSKMCTDGTRHKDISSRIHDKSIISSHIFLPMLSAPGSKAALDRYARRETAC